ncbi:MAG: acyl-CoA thioesterase [Clostridia bacterium]|nr:acyl-CoA thioesterase [Clostridia bacterium]
MYIYRRKAQYHETDKMGVIHHSNYIKWMEEARIEYTESVGISFTAYDAAGIFSPIISVALEYKRPLHFGDEADIAVSVAKYNGTVLELAYTITNAATGEVCTTGTTRNCFVRDGRVVSLKKAFPEEDLKLRSLVE